MKKRSQRRPSRHERDHAGCVWGLISMFHFRHGRSTKRLLSERRRFSKQPVDAGHSSIQTVLPNPPEKCESIADDEELKMPLVDNHKTSVKELMEEEMFKEEGAIKLENDYEKGSEQINLKYGHSVNKNQKRRNRNSNKSNDMDASELDAIKCLMPEIFHKVPDLKSLNNLDLQTILEELAQINENDTNCLKQGFDGDLDVPCGQSVTDVEEKIVAAVKLLIQQRMNDGKHFGAGGKSSFSKELADAFQTLSLNKGLLLKLLRDPNSELVKQIRNLEDARFEKDQMPSSLPALGLSEEKSGNLKSDELSSRKHRNFFRRRSKSMESYPFEGNKDRESSSKIVILKPGPPGEDSPEADMMGRRNSFHSENMDNKMHHEKHPSHFSFTEIKRKLRHAMGKERQGISPDGLILKVSSNNQNGNDGDKGASGESFGWSSPNRNHFYTERFAKSSTSFRKGEQVGRLKDNDSTVGNETIQYRRLGVSNIYIEAKKHLSEVLNNSEENSSKTGQSLKSLGRILSFSEYGSSPCYSPRKYGDDIFITAQMRLSPRGTVKNNVNGLLQDNHNNHSSPSRRSLDSQPRISSGNSDDKLQSSNANVDIQSTNNQEGSLPIPAIKEGSPIPDGPSSPSRSIKIEETTKSNPQDAEQIPNICSESSSNSISGDIQNGDNREVDKRYEDYPECINLELLGEDQILSSPTESPCSPVSKETKDSDFSIDRVDRPSPISVLEPLFTDDDVSPASTKSKPVEKEIQPRQIHFEEQSSISDQGTCIRISLEDEESAFEYVEAVLLGSGLNWDEFLLRWLSLYEILDLSLFDEVEIFSSRSHNDQKLLFDCTNEVLMEVCESYFGCFTGISHVKQNLRPPPKGMDLIHEIWRRVEWHLYQYPMPHSLEQLVKRDMAKPGTWMNIRSEIEIMGFELGETIFDEMVEDTIQSFLDDDTSDSECGFEVLPSECIVIEDVTL